MTEPEPEPGVGGGGLCCAVETLPAGVLIRGGCSTLRRGEERRASGAGDHGPVTPGSR